MADAKHGHVEYRAVWPTDFSLVPANVCRISRINDQFQLTFGYINMMQILDQVEEMKNHGTPESKFSTPATHPVGVIMTRYNFEELFQRMHEILEKVREQESSFEPESNE